MQLQVEIRRKSFRSFEKHGQVAALENVRFAAGPGEFLCFLGPSGCGKTTLLNLIAGLDSDFEGAISLNGSASGSREPRIGYVFQNPRLLPWRTIEENLRLVLSPAQNESGILDELLASTELDAFRNTYPSQLSIGMQRRVSLIRAFSIQPDLLVMDEPFVSLDKPMAENLRKLLLDYWQSRSPTVLFVTHHLSEALQLASRLLVFSTRPGTLSLDVPLALPCAERTTPEAISALTVQLTQQHPEIARLL
ncbi:MAG: ABC transporter ATP-binding protein [SAR324 cluster bacterium]|nr:ABC transporter ATP-binding protein [SAR324 cluster bacterium]